MTTWRLLPNETRTAALNMGLDEAVMENVAAGNSPPTLRLYRWDPAAVSIGCFQSLHDEVDTAECRGRGVDVVRRITGGGAVYHGDEITYSVAAPLDAVPDGVTESYREICGWLVHALETLDMDAAFEPVNDVTVNGRKVSGSAQTRRRGALLQHGTVIHDLDVREMFTLLTPGEEKLSDKAVDAVEDRVTSVKRESGASLDELEAALLDGLVVGKDWEESGFTDAELARAEELAEEKYGSEEWTGKR